MMAEHEVWFPRVVGHEAAKTALRRAVEAGRIGGSLLFCGPAGVGRALLARELAMALNCKGRAAGSAGEVPCRSCGPCHRIEAERCGDYVVLRPEKKPSIGIEQVQGLLEELALAPVECRTRVFLVDPASALTDPAQNALLKGLEEPPRDALLVLTAEREEELLATIASRCLVLRLGELEHGAVVAVLRAQGVEAGEAATRAAWSGGSPGRALAEDALGVAELCERLVQALVSGEAARDPMATVEVLEGFVEPGRADTATQRARVATVLGLLLRTLRDALVLREGPRPGGLARLSGAPPDLLDRLAEVTSDRLTDAVDLLVRAGEDLGQNVNVKMLLDGIVLDVAATLAPPALESARAAAVGRSGGARGGGAAVATVGGGEPSGPRGPGPTRRR